MDRDQLSIISKNTRLVKKIINESYPLSSFINCEDKTIFCPFHHNTDTPSAQVYKDVDGIYRIYCFSENRQYTAYDYIKLILGKEPITYLYNIEVDESIIEEEQQNISKKDSEEVDFIKSHFDKEINSFFKEVYAKK